MEILKRDRFILVVIFHLLWIKYVLTFLMNNVFLTCKKIKNLHLEFKYLKN